MPTPRPILTPVTLFNVAAAGATRSKLLWPGGSYVSTLPAKATGNFEALNDATNDVGAVFSPPSTWGGVLLDFAGVGAADLSLTVEIGRFHDTGTLARPMASVVFKSGSAYSPANVNPFTAEATAATTWRLVDLITKTDYAGLAQVLPNVGGTDDDRPSQLLLDVSEAAYYYVLVTSLSTLTRALCVMTPVR